MVNSKKHPCMHQHQKKVSFMSLGKPGNCQLPIPRGIEKLKF